MPAPRVCVHCARPFAYRCRGRGLCVVCHTDKSVRRLYKRSGEGGRRPELTQSQLDALVARQYACLPAWWNNESDREQRSAPPVRVPRVVRLLVRGFSHDL